MNFDQSIRFLWNADQTQIYRTLGELERDGLAAHSVEPQDGKPNKKVYTLTVSGIEELTRWLSSPVQPGNARNGELLHIFFSGNASNETVLANLKATREGILTGLAGLASLAERSELFDPEVTRARHRFFHECTRALGIRSAELNLRWIDELIEKLESGMVPA